MANLREQLQGLIQEAIEVLHSLLDALSEFQADDIELDIILSGGHKAKMERIIENSTKNGGSSENGQMLLTLEVPPCGSCSEKDEESDGQSISPKSMQERTSIHSAGTATPVSRHSLYRNSITRGFNGRMDSFLSNFDDFAQDITNKINALNSRLDLLGYTSSEEDNRH